jgi:hypothetical protein
VTFEPNSPQTGIPIHVVADDVMACPDCGGLQTHLDEVWCYTRPMGEDGPVRLVIINEAGMVFQPDFIEPPSPAVFLGRRHVFLLVGYCEDCCFAPSESDREWPRRTKSIVLIARQHKGATLVGSTWGMYTPVDRLYEPTGRLP